MNMERACLLGRKSQVCDDIRRLTMRCDGEVRHIRQLTTPGMVKVEDLEVPRLLDVTQQLSEFWGELNKALSDLETINEELGVNG